MTVLTQPRPLITHAEKEAFEEQGYHIVRNALSSKEIENYREALARLLLTPENHPYASQLATTDLRTDPENNPRGIWAGFNIQLFDDCFWDLAYHPNLALTVDALIGPDINLYETCSISKMPQFPADFRDWHQDSQYSDPQSDTLNVTAIVYLDPMDGASGATWVVPGTHKLGALPHVLPAESLSSKALEVADKHLYAPHGVSFDFQPGDALIFLVRLVHKSGSNLTDRSRWSLAYNYTNKNTFDLAGLNSYVGGYLPIVRNGALYTPGLRVAT
jgi:phytanoyl-CoA hydroxylase